MLRIKPFRGLRPAPSLVSKVACVPYDVVNSSEAAALAAGLPESLLHVDRAEIDLPPGTDVYSDIVYETAKKNFSALQIRGALIRDEAPALFIYRQRMNDHVQTGLAAVCHIEDYENEVIKKHEKTRRDKEDDRTKLIGTISANTGPVFLTYRRREAIDAIIARETMAAPLYDFVAPDGVQHTVWRISETAVLVKEFSFIPTAYVADGHHRTASACRVGRERREANSNHTGDEDYNWFLAVIFPDKELQILPYNRVVKDLNGLSSSEYLTKVKECFKISASKSARPARPGSIQMYFEGEWSGLEWTPEAEGDPISQLDVSALQDRLLGPVLCIDDPRTSKRIDFIGGIRGTEELEKIVNRGDAAVAFSMFPTTVDQLMAIADAGQIMPPKSTWFEPKLRSGLFIHTF